MVERGVSRLAPPSPTEEPRPRSSGERFVGGRPPNRSPRGDPGSERLFKPSKVASLFQVHRGTVGRWARIGKLSAIRTLGGHYRFPASDVYRLLEERDAWL